eukprot:2113156-Pleurochrysis_carterae.AAC.1
MDYIEELLNTCRTTVHTVEGDSSSPSVGVAVKLSFCGDFAGVRAIEGAVCGCPPESMHTVPLASELTSVDDLLSVVRACDCTSTHTQRTARAHQPLRDGRLLPCDCCSFVCDPSTSAAKLSAFEQKLFSL